MICVRKGRPSLCGVSASQQPGVADVTPCAKPRPAACGIFAPLFRIQMPCTTALVQGRFSRMPMLQWTHDGRMLPAEGH